MDLNNKWALYVISGILWDDNDLSYNMKLFLEKSDLLFVEEIWIFKRLINENNIKFRWELIEMNNSFSISKHKKQIIYFLLQNKNIWIFESSWTACLVDPWVEIVDFVYKILEKVNTKIIPIPWTWAIQTAISVSGFDMDKYIFLNWINSNTKNEIELYNLPIVYFNHFSNYSELDNVINFMKNIENRMWFIWINLWKKWVKYSNLLIRWNLKDIYLKFKKLFQGEILPDLVFIFNKKWE